MAVAKAAAQEAAEAAAAGYAAKLDAAREEAAGQMASELQAAAQVHEAALSTLTTEQAQALEAAREEAAQAVEAQWARRYDAEVERCKKELEAGYREAMVAPRKFGALAVAACEALKKRKPMQATKSLKEAAQYAIDLELVIQKVVKLSPEEQAHADAMAAAAQAVL
jgi:hypothetical protein